MKQTIKKSELRNLVKEVIKEETSKRRLNESNTYFLDNLQVDPEWEQNLYDKYPKVLELVSKSIDLADQLVEKLGDDFNGIKFVYETGKLEPLDSHSTFVYLNRYVEFLQNAMEEFASNTDDKKLINNISKQLKIVIKQLDDAATKVGMIK